VNRRIGLPGAAQEFVRHQGLLVPADAVSDLAATEAGELREELAAARELTAVRWEDAWVRRARQTEHRIAMADVDERAAAAERARRERARDAAEADALAALYRRATRSGARARIRAQIQGAAEMRALRVAAVRRVALAAGLPVLAAFAAWSTTGAQAGVVRLLNLSDGSAAWWASWAVEPALITVVALIIIGRAVLRSSGGSTDWRAAVAEWTALGLSLALNIVGGWHGGWQGLAGALPHSIGPLGAAGTAFLIGLFDAYVTAARPWDGAPHLADLDLIPQSVATVPAATVAAAVPLRPVPKAATGTQPAAVPGGTGTRRAVHAGTGTAVPGRRAGTGPGRSRAVPAAGTGSRQAITARTGTGTAPGSAKAAARAFWQAEVAAGRVPTGAELARAAGKDNDESGMFRRCAREWAAELDVDGRAGGGEPDADAS
jgi:hypothetical protein